MKNRIAYLLLASFLLLSLVGCGEDASVADIQRVSPYSPDDVARSGAVTFPPNLASLREALSSLSNDTALSNVQGMFPEGEEGIESLRSLMMLRPGAIEDEIEAKVQELVDQIEAFEESRKIAFSMNFVDADLDAYWRLEKAALSVNASLNTTDGQAIGTNNFKSAGGSATAELRIATRDESLGDSIIRGFKAGMNAGVSVDISGKNGAPDRISAQLGLSLEFALSFKTEEGVGGIVVFSFYVRSGVSASLQEELDPDAIIPTIEARIALYDDNNTQVFSESFASLGAMMEALEIELDGGDEG